MISRISKPVVPYMFLHVKSFHEVTCALPFSKKNISAAKLGSSSFIGAQGPPESENPQRFFTCNMLFYETLMSVL